MTGPSENLSYGEVLRHLKEGRRVCRAGWNGKGMWLVYIKPTHYAISQSVMVELGSAYLEGQVDIFELLPFIAMKTADNKIVPWLASQTDMLAEDWAVFL